MSESKDTLSRAIGYMAYLISIPAQATAYATWSDNFCRSEMHDAFKKVKLETDKEFWDNVFDLSVKDKFLLGFKKFDENTDKMLIPLWIIECLPNDYTKEVSTVLGNTVILSNQVKDKEVRAGCTCYMV